MSQEKYESKIRDVIPEWDIMDGLGHNRHSGRRIDIAQGEWGVTELGGR